MKGKNKCKILKEIRQRIADENDIPYVTRECTYQGDCKGTCPKCEAELRYLEQELEKRRRLGKSVAVAAVAAGLSMTLSACVPGGSSGGGAAGADPSGTLPSLVEPTQPTERVDALAGNIEVTEIMGELPADTVVYIPPETEEELTGEPEPYPGWSAGETEAPAETFGR